MKSLFQLAQFAVAALLAGATVNHAASESASQPSTHPKRVTGIGGVFFKSKDPPAMRQWYADHLGFNIDQWGTNFEWRQADAGTKKAFTQWSPHSDQTKYFEPSTKDFMFNFRVENLDWLLDQLKKENVRIVGQVQHETYGKFAWIMDLEGNKIELWEPNDQVYDQMTKHRTK